MNTTYFKYIFFITIVRSFLRMFFLKHTLVFCTIEVIPTYITAKCIINIIMNKILLKLLDYCTFIAQEADMLLVPAIWCNFMFLSPKIHTCPKLMGIEMYVQSQ